MTDQAFVDPVFLASQGGNLLQARHFHQGLVTLLMQVCQLIAVCVSLRDRPLDLLLQLALLGC